MNQKRMVLDYMKANGSITSLDAFRELGITRLSDVVFRLRNEGYEIETKTESSTNRWGDKTSYARYEINRAPDHERLGK